MAGALAGKALGTAWVRVVCPFCPSREGSADHKLSLAYKPDSGVFTCWRCHAKGCMPEPVRERLPYMQPSGAYAGGAAGPEVERLVDFTPLFTGSGATSILLQPARDYLTGTGRTPAGVRRRGLPAASCAAAEVGVAAWGVGMDAQGQEKRRPLGGRVIVPIREAGQPELLGWFARDFTGGAYLSHVNARGMPAVLYREEFLSVVTDVPVYLVEGCMDALALWPDAAALLGTSITPYHIGRVVTLCQQSGRPVVVCLDGDAWEKGWNFGMRLRHYGLRAGSVRLGPRVDPDEVPRDALDRAAVQSLGSLRSVTL